MISDLVTAALRAEAEHVLFGGTGDLRGCTCGARLHASRPFEIRLHRHRAQVEAVLDALCQPCIYCKGEGMVASMRSVSSCPECDGRGKTAIPLDSFYFRDDAQRIWRVTDPTGAILNQVIDRADVV